MEVRIIRRIFGIIVVLSSFVLSEASYAQCAMCRAALNSGDNKAKAEAVNDGIVYLMVIPYLLVGIIIYVVYRMKKE